MSGNILTVGQAAAQLGLHPRTVLRYIREGRLPATRIGKAYRIERTRLEAFAGISSGPTDTAAARATCIVELSGTDVEGAQRLATLLGAAALTGDAGTPPLHVSTAFDPDRASLKVVVVGSPGDAARMLDLVEMHLARR